MNFKPPYSNKKADQNQQKNGENLPPLNAGGSRQSIQATNQKKNAQATLISSSPALSQASTSKLDAQTEMSLVGVLEKKYQHVAQKLDKAEIEVQNSKFQIDILKSDKVELQEKLS